MSRAAAEAAVVAAGGMGRVVTDWKCAGGADMRERLFHVRH